MIRLKNESGVVVDSFVIVALLTDNGELGRWATESVEGNRLLAPDLLPYEVTNVLRRQVQAGNISQAAANSAYLDLISFPFELYPYALLSNRVWELRENLTAYDAAYIALSELLDVPLITLDVRVTRVPGTHCRILTFPHQLSQSAR